MTLGSVKAQNMALDASYGDNHSSVWPGTVWIHLFAGDPTLGAAEMSGGGYVPISVANNSAHWPNAQAGLKVNGLTETFPMSTGAWSAPATFFWLSDAEFQLLAPAAPTITNVGTAGVVNYQYEITVLNAMGESTPSGIGVTTTGNNLLNGTNYNHVAWNSVTGATSYNVYKLVGSVFELLTNTTSLTYNDQGAATGTQQPPLSNTTMTLLDGGPLSVPVRVLTAGLVVGFPPSSIVIGD